MVDGDFTGGVEKTAIYDRIQDLAGGRVFRGQVPDGYDPPRSDGKIKPYIIIRFAKPISAEINRGIALTEQQQPHLLSGTITVCADDYDAADATSTAALQRLIGFRPSDTSGVVRARGGVSWPVSDTSSRPTRYQDSFFFRVYLNV